MDMGPGCRLEISTRESTRYSLIRDSNAGDAPGLTTKQRMSTFTNQNQRIYDHIQINIPTTYEMEQYNFNIANDVPLLGRYEWVQVHH
ncbi:Cyclin-dependent kinase inhibitor 3 [Spatholobus suberectus]|nr:Cyclin-dependent kinase inhibitor 3 [Spatholobus suberectus]